MSDGLSAPTDMPPDPVSRDRSDALSFHQRLDEYESAGFTHEEAFELLTISVTAWWDHVWQVELARRLHGLHDGDDQ